MRLVIIHYHLERGGVTQVISNHIRALSEIDAHGIDDVLVLHGGRNGGWPNSESLTQFPFTVRDKTVSTLEYDAADCTTSFEDCQAEIRKVICEESLTADNTLFHIHNHSLGKNAAFTRAVSFIAECGFHCLLQIHDFAEDFRPENYDHLIQFSEQHKIRSGRYLYPQADHIHYAVLNSRDYNLLVQSGIPESSTHLLPNPVGIPDNVSNRDAARVALDRYLGVNATTPYILYPVRGIRRKNLGEFVLWGAVAKQMCTANVPTFGLTLAPKNTTEQPNFHYWRDFCRDQEIPCILGTAELGMSFGDSISAADAIITTSVTEGFGMVFLEASLNEKRLIGRDLPQITHDFRRNSINLDSLYDSIRIPIEWIDANEFRQSVASIYIDATSAYKIPSTPLKTAADHIDFAKLTTNLQSKIIRMILAEPDYINMLISLNPALSVITEITTNSDSVVGEVTHNKQIIKSVYGFENSGVKLCGTYETVMNSPISDIQELSDPDHIIQSLIQSDNIYPVRHA